MTGAFSVSATTIIEPTDEQLTEKSRLVIRGTVQRTGPVDIGGRIWTETAVQVEKVLRGNGVSEGEVILVREVGGQIGDRLVRVWGAPEFEPGERVMLFLVPTPRGDYQTMDLFMGKFSERVVNGRRQWWRPNRVQGTHILDPQMQEKRFNSPGTSRDADAFEDFVGRHRRPAMAPAVTNGRAHQPHTDPRSMEQPPNGDDAAPPYQIGFSDAITTEPASSGYDVSANFTLIAEPNIYRWFAFDRGETVPWYSIGSQPGYSGGGVTEFQQGLSAWTSYTAANIRMSYAGASGAQPGGLNGVNNINEVDFNDPFDEVAGTFTGNGTVAIGGFSRSTTSKVSWTSTFAADASHPQRTYTNPGEILEGNVVVQTGVSPSTGVTSSELAELLAHELGHALGFGHSSDPQAIMYGSIAGLGPTLRADDQLAARWLYPGSSAPTCTAPNVTAHPNSATITAGQSVTISVSATGTAPLSYQWYIGVSPNTAQPLSGATGASITVAPTTTTQYWVRLTNACGSQNSGTGTVTVNAPPPPAGGYVAGDFNRDNMPDILFQQTNGPALNLWFMSGTTKSGETAVPSAGVTDWRVVGIDDWDKDGDSDLLWGHRVTGQYVMWFMNGTALVSSANVPSPGSTLWRVAGTGDFSGDGNPDILWQQTQTGQCYIWYMSGPNRIGEGNVNNAGSSAWVVGAVADFDRDGDSDIFWRNRSTGQNYMWLMNGAALVQGLNVNQIADLNWQVAASSDYSLDGYPDILWRHNTTGALQLWTMVNNANTSTRSMASPGSSWVVSGPR